MKVTNTTTIDLKEHELLAFIEKHIRNEYNVQEQSRVYVLIREHSQGYGEDPFLTCQITITHPEES